MAYREEHDIGRLAWVGPQSESAFLVTGKAVCYHAVGGRFQYKGRVGGIRAVLPTGQVGQAAAKPACMAQASLLLASHHAVSTARIHH